MARETIAGCSVGAGEAEGDPGTVSVTSVTVTGITMEEECQELFPVNLQGGSRFLHLTVLCSPP